MAHTIIFKKNEVGRDLNKYLKRISDNLVFLKETSADAVQCQWWWCSGGMVARLCRCCCGVCAVQMWCQFDVMLLLFSAHAVSCWSGADAVPMQFRCRANAVPVLC